MTKEISGVALALVFTLAVLGSFLGAILWFTPSDKDPPQGTGTPVRDTLGAEQRQQSVDYRQLQADHTVLLRKHQQVLEERLKELEGQISCQESLVECQVARCRLICAEREAPCPELCLDLLKGKDPFQPGD